MIVPDPALRRWRSAAQPRIRFRSKEQRTIAHGHLGTSPTSSARSFHQSPAHFFWCHRRRNGAFLHGGNLKPSCVEEPPPPRPHGLRGHGGSPNSQTEEEGCHETFEPFVDVPRAGRRR